MESLPSIEGTTSWDAAFLLAELGIPVFPVTVDKTPFEGTHGFKDATKSRSQLEAWRKLYPHALIGIPTGTRTDIAVLDFDHCRPEDLESRIAAVEREFGQLPETARVSTPRGFHFYFRCGGRRFRSCTRFMENMDLKADGGYVVAPPSVSIHGEYKVDTSGSTAMAPLPSSFAGLGPNGSRKAGIPSKMNKPRNPGNLHTSGVHNLGENFPLEPKLSVGDVIALLQNERVLALVCSKLGIKSRGSFKCPIHEERHPSANLIRGNNGNYGVYCFHGRSEECVETADGDTAPKAFYLLPEVYACKVGGRERRLDAGELRFYSLKLLVDSGVVQPYPVEFEPLPADVPQSARDVYETVLEIARVRWINDPGSPIPLARGFLKDLAGLSETTVRAGIAWLERHGYIRHVGCTGRLYLWMPAVKA
jgi:hypothetical protein